MPESVIIALISTVPSIMALIGVIYSIRVSREGRADAAETKVIATETKAIALNTELNTNSMKDALVASTAKASHAEGMADEKAAEKARNG